MTALGIFRYYEFIAPIIPIDRITYLGEGHTPVVEANDRLKEMVGTNFYFKNDGMNPSGLMSDHVENPRIDAMPSSHAAPVI